MSLLPKIKEIIENHLKPTSDYLFGFADLKGVFTNELSEYKSGISIVRRLDDKILNGILKGPTLEYSEHYNEVNQELGRIEDLICEELNESGITCNAIRPSFSMNSDEFKPYLEALRYKVSHKMLATKAGLGWIGKTDLFVSYKFGPRVRLTSILLEPELPVKAKPVIKSECNTCTVCVKKCPANAANGILWDIYTDRDVYFNPWKCREKCTELGYLLLKEDRGICGICVAVCPIGRKHKLN